MNLSAGESCHINADRFDLTIYALTPKCAALVNQITDDRVTLTRDELVKGSRFLKPLTTRYHGIPLERFCEKGCLLTTEVKRIEQYGRYRGYANYHFGFAGEGDIVGLLVNEVSDVCSVYLNDVYLGTSVACNNHHLVSLDRQNLGNDNAW